ncbi:hypothetical protein TIFTF001_006096 [Ficus carica]|uniref:Prolamin-like domain-containing protein n=1 Tax=Ficus carica TaxID=3494 RepID=A0AA87ZQB5_FICCA|nr:hypothetical protein TIFTF001_006096 [Ficus carica]
MLVLPAGCAVPAPPPINDKFLLDCAINLRASCGTEVFYAVFKNATVSASCCQRLVSVVKLCHEEMVKYCLSQHPLYEGNRNEILVQLSTNLE